MKRKYKYMHTIKGRPANFKQQICCGCQYIELVDDLKTIKKQQKESSNWRKKKGYSESSKEYGYKKIIYKRK